MARDYQEKLNENRPILVIGAMEDVELNYLQAKLEGLKVNKYSGFYFFEGKIANKDVVLCASNIGLINASIVTTIAIEKYNPKFIINEGLAGGITKNVRAGDIVIGISAVNISSMECVGEGEKIEDYEITSFLHNEPNRVIYQNADEGLILQIKENFTEDGLHFGIIGSGDIWNKNINRINYINEKCGAICEDMESVAIYTVANLYNVPVIGVKGISDNEILGETYTYDMSEKIQKYTEKIIAKIG